MKRLTPFSLHPVLAQLKRQIATSRPTLSTQTILGSDRQVTKCPPIIDLELASRKLAVIQELMPERKQLIKRMVDSILNKMEDRKQAGTIGCQEHQKFKGDIIDKYLNQIVFDINEGLCIICYDRKAESIVRECRHLVACKQCCENLKLYSRNCPVCQKQGTYQTVTTKN